MATALMLAVATFGFATIPTVVPWIWVVTFGVGAGAIFPLCLALPLDLEADGTGAARLTAWMLGIGYTTSASSPAVIGALRDATGGFTTPMMILAGVSLGAALVASTPRLKTTTPAGCARQRHPESR